MKCYGPGFANTRTGQIPGEGRGRARRSTRAAAARAHVVEGTRVGVVAPGSHKGVLCLEHACFTPESYPRATGIRVFAMALRVWVCRIKVACGLSVVHSPVWFKSAHPGRGVANQALGN